jgi:predicted ArsR family transcriptional regulator
MNQKANRQRIAEALKKADHSAGQLAKSLHMGNTTAWRWLQLLVADEEAFVCEMISAPHGGPPIAIYRTGSKPEGFVVKRQARKTQMEIVRKYRAKLRMTGDWDDVVARQRAYYWRKKQIGRDPLTAAFFGSAA